MKKQNILIFVEGQSEENYIKQLKTKIPFINAGYLITIKQFQTIDDKKIIEEIDLFRKDSLKRTGIPFTNTYLFLDTDVIVTGRLEKIFKKAKRMNVCVLHSNPIFEVFLLLHYKEFCSCQSNDRYFQELTREMSLSSAGGYEINKAKLHEYNKYDDLITVAKLRVCITNFNKLIKYHKKENDGTLSYLLNPYTNIFLFLKDIGLIEKLGVTIEQ